jgi:hypothetical protein
MKQMFKIILWILSSIIFLLAVFISYLYVGWTTKSKNITWGVDFSQMQAEALELDWKEIYLAMINDLNVKNIKLHTQWDWVEGKNEDYFFNDIDWQIKQAEENNVKIIFVLGIKTGRWPECHVPKWAEKLSKEEQQKKALEYIKQIVLRYKDSESIKYWQVENEPLLKFGECPDWYYDGGEFVKKEVELVKSLDPERKIVISDSGELSFWLKAAKIGDILGTTMYRKSWVDVSSYNFPSFIIKHIPNFYGTYPILPVHYWRKAQMIKMIYGKSTICIELQAEPWPRDQIFDTSPEEQSKTMDLNQFRKNVEYAKKTGLDTFYFWGVEWWYWMKEIQNNSSIWDEAKNLFNK